MKKSELEIKVNSESAIRKIQKATDAINKFKKALGDLKEIEINVEVVNIKNKWWQFWK